MQMMNILIVNQSVIDMLVSIFILLKDVGTKRTGMSRESAYDQFVCRFWITKKPLWCMLVTSTYSIVIMTLSRYIAVIYPIHYKTVRIAVFVPFVREVYDAKTYTATKNGLEHHGLMACFDAQ